MKKDGIYVIFDAKSDKMGRLADKKQNILLRAIVGKNAAGDSIKRQERGGFCDEPIAIEVEKSEGVKIYTFADKDVVTEVKIAGDNIIRSNYNMQRHRNARCFILNRHIFIVSR